MQTMQNIEYHLMSKPFPASLRILPTLLFSCVSQTDSSTTFLVSVFREVIFYSMTPSAHLYAGNLIS